MGYGLAKGLLKIHMLKALSPGRQHWEAVELLGGGPTGKSLMSLEGDCRIQPILSSLLLLG